MTTAEAFDRGAGRYDLLVSLNPGYHAHLRSAARELLRRIRPARGERPAVLLDLACGSGASTRALLDAAEPGDEILGIDASAGMLAEAGRKPWPARVTFERGTVGSLDVDGLGRGAHDGILAAYLLRNIPAGQRDVAVRECFELLAPGGWIVAEEYSVAGRPLDALRWTLVSWLAIIPLGALLDRNPGLYAYLWRSVLAFDDRARFARRLREAGFEGVRVRTVGGWQRGILHIAVGRRPRASSAGPRRPEAGAR